ncbi:MAG: tRNA uridine-5-carboxymethylaminomethyl(34) synthesis enzyme MnmG, partial [FCB group bacterium]|nr:tRNA uridine-5-carboxymethylaminomethyl(34) synthesis enzyme MnmG [FCB group bacterium]
RRLSCTVILITFDKARIGEMSCNPAIGGIAKGTLVREIDALGGAMARSADRSRLQFRMLNRKKGPAVWGPRVQSDAAEYAKSQHLELVSAGVDILEDEVTKLLGETKKVKGVKCRNTGEIRGKTVVIAAGTFLRGILYRGDEKWEGGRVNDKSSLLLEEDLRKRMFHMERFKTGTPPRIYRDTVDTSKLIVQNGESGKYLFSISSTEPSQYTEPCYITATNEDTMNSAKRYIPESPLMSGKIEGIGPRYCPSYEDKVVKFPKRLKHTIFVEPMGQTSEYFYLNGISTSLPRAAQVEMVKSLPGFENAEIAVYGYAVEYSFFDSAEIDSTLRLVRTENVYSAGQVCGTSGYEEAAALGLMAGTNAARNVLEKEALVPNRMESYLGVMIEDITLKGAKEPYRLFSSRAENRLHLRQDNAERRLFSFALHLNVLSPLQRKGTKKRIDDAIRIKSIIDESVIERIKGSKWCRRPEIEVDNLIREIPDLLNFEKDLVESVMLDEKYDGYIRRNNKLVDDTRKASAVKLNQIENYMQIDEICREAREILEAAKPKTLADAEKLPGLRPTDLQGLLLHIMLMGKEKRNVPRET